MSEKEQKKRGGCLKIKETPSKTLISKFKNLTKNERLLLPITKVTCNF